MSALAADDSHKMIHCTLYPRPMRRMRFVSPVSIRMFCTGEKSKKVNATIAWNGLEHGSLTPLHSDVIQSTPSQGRKIHFFVSSGRGSVQSASSNTSIFLSTFVKHFIRLVCSPSPHNLLHYNCSGNQISKIISPASMRIPKISLTAFHAPTCHWGHFLPTLHDVSVAGLLPTFCRHSESSNTFAVLQTKKMSKLCRHCPDWRSN